MKMRLFDTNILIDHLKGKSAATLILQGSVSEGLLLACSVITRIELINGMRPEEEKILEGLLSSFEKIGVTDNIAGQAGKYLNIYRKSHGINMADAIIAASAKHANSQLYTLNIKHYPMKDIEVVKPY